MVSRWLDGVAGARRLCTVLSLGALVALATGAAGASLQGGSASVMGRVQSIGGSSLTVESKLTQTNELAITPDTRFVEGGKQISPDQIQPGDEVRTSFRAEKGALVATQVQVVRKAGAQAISEETRPSVELAPPPGRHVPGGR